MNPKRTHKELQEIQKQVNEIKEINKLWHETKETVGQDVKEEL
jgi:hypothetical protein